MEYPNCSGTDLKWTADKVNRSLVQDGRFRMHDIGIIFVLGCEECSETIRIIDAESKDGVLLLNG